MPETPDQTTPPPPVHDAKWLRTAWGGIGALAVAIFGLWQPSLWVIFVAAVIWLAWGIAAESVERDDVRQRTAQQTKAAPKTYYNRVGGLLTWLADTLLPGMVAKTPRPTAWGERIDWAITPLARDADDIECLKRNPFSWPVHDLALRIAIAYPIFFVAVQYLITGNQVTMADHGLIPEDTSYGWTLATFGLIVAALVSRILASATSKGVFEKLSTWLVWVAFALALALAFASAVAFALAFAFGLALAFAGASAVAFALAFAFAFAFALALAFAGAVAFAFAFAFAVSIAVFALCRRGHRLGQLGYLLFNLLAVAVAFVAAITVPEDNPLTVWIIAFALLPAVNALFDWLSYGITILLLRTGHKWQGPWRAIFGALDLLVAAGLFFALSLALIGALTLVDAYRAVPLFDLPAMLRDIQNGKLSDHAWVLAMVASTLVPTLVHLAIGFFSLMTLIRASVWEWLSTRLTTEETMGTQLAASLSFGLLRLGFLGLPMGLLFGVVYLLWLFGSAIAARYATGLIWATSSLGWFTG